MINMCLGKNFPMDMRRAQGAVSTCAGAVRMNSDI